MDDTVLDELLARHGQRLRTASSLEKLRCKETGDYFELEMQRPLGEGPTYKLSRMNHSDGGLSSWRVIEADLARTLRGETPFIPALLNATGRGSFAQSAQTMFEKSEPASFLFDGLVLTHARLSVQFDQADAAVPDGFKLCAEFQGEVAPTYYDIHNDIVVCAVQTGNVILKLALQICPKVVGKWASYEPDLRALWEAGQISEAAMPVEVAGRPLRI